MKYIIDGKEVVVKPFNPDDDLLDKNVVKTDEDEEVTGEDNNE